MGSSMPKKPSNAPNGKNPFHDDLKNTARLFVTVDCDVEITENIDWDKLAQQIYDLFPKKKATSSGEVKIQQFPPWVRILPP